MTEIRSSTVCTRFGQPLEPCFAPPCQSRRNGQSAPNGGKRARSRARRCRSVADAQDIRLHPRLQRGRQDRSRDRERAVGRRGRGRRLQQHRRTRSRSPQALGARVVQVPFTGFGELRNRAIEACRHEWIFSLDSDERCTAAVRDEILALLAARARARRLSRPAPLLHDGTLDQAAPAGIRTTASRSSSARARCATSPIRCTRATSS